MIPALLGLIAPVAAVKVLSSLARAAGAALRSATAPVSLPSPSVAEKAAEVSEQVSDSPVIFAYDGMSRRTKITELSNGTVTSKKLYWWLGGTIVCERDGLVSGFPITKRYFGQGLVQGTTKLFYTFDHLGSVRELVDSAGVVQAQYRYSTYGERTKESGNLEADFGYAGLWHHGPSGLDLATYRVYDSINKRWISRDPLGEGVDYNLYRYCVNNPISNVDPAGLTPAAALTLVGGAAVAPEAIVTTALTAVAVSLAGAVEAQMQAEAAELALQATLAAQAAQMARKGAETAQRAKRTAEELSRAAKVGWCTRRYNQEIKECQMKFPFDARERAVCYSQASERLAACIGRAWQCSNRYPPKYNP